MGFFATPCHTHSSPRRTDPTDVLHAAGSRVADPVFVFVFVQEVRRVRDGDAYDDVAMLMMGVGKGGYEVSYETSPGLGKMGEVALTDVVLDAEWGRACAISEMVIQGKGSNFGTHPT